MEGAAQGITDGFQIIGACAFKRWAVMPGSARNEWKGRALRRRGLKHKFQFPGPTGAKAVEASRVRLQDAQHNSFSNG